MSKIHLKLIIWALLAAIASAGMWSALSGIAQLFLYFQTGANPAAALNIVPNTPPDLHVRLSWRPDDADTGRQLDPLVRREIESSYSRAWLQLHLATARGDNYGLQTYFTGSAMAAAEQLSRELGASGWHVDQVDTSHDLQLHFYSADGSIISFTDHDAWVSRLATRRDSAPFSMDSRADYDVVMLLEDGNWRIRHWVIREAVDVQATRRIPTASDLVAQAGAHLTLEGRQFDVVGIDYYPRDAPWDRFWPSYDSQQTRQDFELTRRLGINTVRVSVHYDQFGGPVVDPQMLDHLQDLLDRAKDAGLKVAVTLFEGFSGYPVLKWPAGDRHLEAILLPLRDHAAVLTWELSSRPEAAYAQHGQMRVDGWLQHIVKWARHCDPNHLLTVGWASAAPAADWTNVLDIASFHHLGPAAALEQDYLNLRTRVKSPVLIMSWGLSTYNSWFLPGGHSEREQEAHYADLLRFFRRSDVSGGIASALFDYAAEPPGVSRWEPWRIGSMQRRGIVRNDGTVKPAAFLFGRGRDLSGVPVPFWIILLKPFWLLVFALGGSLALVAILRRRAPRT